MSNNHKNSFTLLENAEEIIHSSEKQKNENKRELEGDVVHLRQPLIWIDLEMTGLDVENDHILQIACILTDGSLEKVIEGEEFVINQPEEVLEGMNPWCVENHGKSGLTQAVRDSTITLSEAESRTIEFIRRHIPEPDAAQIAGNSVHVDIQFLKKYMPSIVEYSHYRIVDVSSVGELCRRWYPRQYGKGPKKTNKHTAMSDIRESIQQLKYYKKAIFKQGK